MAAARALVESQYRMTVSGISHLATHSNVLFRIDLVDGRRLVLRVSQPASNTRTNIEMEVEWLATLVDDPDLELAAPVPTPDGRAIVDLETEGVHRNCVLFTWVPGEPLGEGAGTSGYRALGRVSALLHGHGDWRPRDPGRLRRWDRTFYYPSELEEVVVDDFRYDHIFTPIRVFLLRTARFCDEAIARRWEREDPMVVHGDLHEWNVHIYLGRAWAIDFEDVMLALPAQDIATSLYGARTRPDLDVVVAAFREGYEEYAIWPVLDRRELEVYWAARQVMLMNHAAQVLGQTDTIEFFSQVLPWLRSFMDRAQGGSRPG